MLRGTSKNKTLGEFCSFTSKRDNRLKLYTLKLMRQWRLQSRALLQFNRIRKLHLVWLTPSQRVSRLFPSQDTLLHRLQSLELSLEDIGSVFSSLFFWSLDHIQKQTRWISHRWSEAWSSQQSLRSEQLHGDFPPRFPFSHVLTETRFHQISSAYTVKEVSSHCCYLNRGREEGEQGKEEGEDRSHSQLFRQQKSKPRAVLGALSLCSPWASQATPSWCNQSQREQLASHTVVSAVDSVFFLITRKPINTMIDNRSY